MAFTTVAFGLADSVLALDLARFLQGVSSAFSWTGALAWLVAAAPAGQRGRLIGSAFGAAIVGALFGPVLGAVASFTGTGTAFGAVAGLALVLFRRGQRRRPQSGRRARSRFSMLVDAILARPQDPDRRVALPPPRPLLRNALRSCAAPPFGPRLGRCRGRSDVPRRRPGSRQPGRRCSADFRINTAACRRFSRLSPGPPSSHFSCRGRTAPGCLRCSSSARASRSEASGHPQCHWSPMQRRREGSTTATRSRS